MNPRERDDVRGTAASSTAEGYRARRQGNLIRGSDGFRSPELARPMRYPGQEGYKPDPPLSPYNENPASPPGAPFPNVPRNFSFFKPAHIGAPYVWFPDQRRTEGKLQSSGAAWGRVGEQRRPVLQPATDGDTEQPTHRLGASSDSCFIPRSSGPRWVRPEAVKRSDHLAH